MPESPRSVPLFPLNTVLFPGMLLPLHIFEPRYRRMISECLDRDREFGVVLIREGLEVGGPAEPFDVGTFARILDVNRLEDGRMNIVVVGVGRFNILEIRQRVPLLVGLVEPFSGRAEAVDGALAKRVGSRYRDFIRELGGDRLREGRIQLSDDPETLSFQIAATLGLGPHERQRLLELESTTERLKGLDRLVRREYSALRVLGRNVPTTSIGPFSPN